MENIFFTENFDNAKKEIVKLGGRITQKFTDSVFVAEMPDSTELNQLKYSTNEQPTKLDDLSQLMLEAWIELLEKQRGYLKKDIKHVNWDTEGFQHPKNPNNSEELRIEFEKIKKNLKSTGTATSERMTGSISVGLIIVAGTSNGLGFSNEENRLVVKEVMEGCQFLASMGEECNVSFVYVVHMLTIDASPNNNCNSYESCESVFRDPSLTKLGYPTGYSGCVDFVTDLKTNNKTDWAYMAFFTKYPMRHFAYAGGVRLCMQYSNDGWGSDQINQVFAHETCHIFGAADEYASSNCTCAVSGIDNVPNYNCENCSVGEKVPCLMNANTLSLCHWSKGQLGWWPSITKTMGAITVDGGRPYVFVKGTDGNLWVNWWSGKVWSWSNQGIPSSSVSITETMGAITVDGGRPYVFVKGSDGNLWVNWWSGKAWNWSNQGTPSSGVSITEMMGAITVDGGRPYVFVKGSDGNLWVNWWSGKAWSWSNQGIPSSSVSITETMGAITVDGGRPYVFVKGSDGNLWVNWWSGKAWSWSNQGIPSSGVSITETMGTITVDGGRPYVFVKGSDGNLWVNWWSGKAWSWSNQGIPSSGVSITETMGAITVDGGRPYVFVKGSDGNLWVNWWSGKAWSWSNQGTPSSGVSITETMGTITVDGGRPYVFVKGSDGNLWVNWWSGKAWSWQII